MLVADVGDGAVREVARRSVITHLGEGWTSTGALSEAAMSRVERTVAGFLAEARELGAAEVTAVATSAARDASNAGDFLARLEEAGVSAEVISGEREAYLSFLGATWGMEGEGLLVADVGGGSTELVLGSVTEGENGPSVQVETARSVDVGSRRVTELYLRSDPPKARELEEATAWLAEELRPAFFSMRERPREMISVAGTATSLAAIAQGLEPYDPARVHGYRLTGPVLLDALESLAAMTLEERRHVPGLEPERAGVIVGGALVLRTVLALAGLPSTLVSEQDILYGMVLDRAMLHGPGTPGSVAER
jgi:exopolyphosphatase/guanosine-5'-triphosphate,3'-diphosphate pyrophosphatase